jgi:DNA-binding SARP family transcriptional activator/TolB-like protein
MPHHLHSRLLLLGQFVLRREGEQPHVINLSSKKARGLVAFLAVQPERTASREQLAALLWGERSDKHARQALRQCLSVLRNELSSAQLEMLNLDGHRIGLKGDVLSIDVLEFLALAESFDATDVAQACTLYRGEFLSGLDLDSEVFEQWVREQRARIEVAAARVLETHARQTDALGKGLQAVATVDRLIAIDPLREDWQRLGLEIHARHQGRDAALARAKSFAALLQAERGVAPDPATRALIADIKAGVGMTVGASGQSVSAALAERIPSQAPAPQAAADEPVSGKAAATDRARHRAEPSRLPPRALRAVFSLRGYALAVGFFAALGIDTILDAGVGPWYDKVFGAPSSAAQHTADLSSQARSLSPATPLLVIAAREEGSADRAVIDAVTDEIAKDLSGRSGIKVLSRQTANWFLTTAGDVTKLGSAFGAQYVVEASLEPQATTTRIHVALLDATSGRTIWSEWIDTPRGVLSRVRAGIGAQFAASIRLALAQQHTTTGTR